MLHDKQSDYHAVGRELADSGRGGLGVATLFSAGNERQTGLDTNDSPVTTMPWVTTVAASDQQGNVTPYSNPGASILVTAPGSWPSSMVTTDRQGTDGYNTEPGTAGDYTDRGFSFFDGTSAAAPVAGGVVALMLEANSGLGYRDIQEILVYSSKRATFLDRDHDFAFNGARDWNGGALLASHDFGFGHIDAHAAVRLAESWTATSTVANLVMEAGQVSQRAVTLEPGQQASLTAYFAPDYRLEQMTVTVNLEGSKLKGATLELISPDGTLSRLINQPPSLLEVIDPDDIEGDDELDEHMVYKLAGYTVNTVLSWGESLAGEWTLRVSNAADGEALHLTDWSILAYTAGEVGPSDSAQIFTDEFARFADLQPERSLIDAANGPVLNAAAVTHDVRFDLSTGISWIGRQELMLDDPAKFQHLVTGDGNDMLIGNAADNILMAGRGNNHVDGGAGLDVMRLIGDASDYTVDLRGDLTVVYSHGLADGGIDVLHNVEVLLFADRVELTREPTDLGPDLFDEAAYLAQYPDIAVGVAAGWLASGYEHYTQWGAAEARNPNALFSEAWYLAANADVALGVREGFLDSGYQHYLNHGWMEGRNPSAWMDASAYLADNPDIAEAQINPFEHYLLHGIHEGRPIVALEADLWI